MGVYDFLNENKLLGLFGNNRANIENQYSNAYATSFGEFALQNKANPNLYTFISKDTTGLEFNPYAFFGQNNNLAVTKTLNAPLEDYMALSEVLKMPISQIAITPPPALSDYQDIQMPTAPVNLGLGNTPGDMAIKAAQQELLNSTYFSSN